MNWNRVMKCKDTIITYNTPSYYILLFKKCFPYFPCIPPPPPQTYLKFYTITNIHSCDNTCLISLRIFCNRNVLNKTIHNSTILLFILIHHTQPHSFFDFFFLLLFFTNRRPMGVKLFRLLLLVFFFFYVYKEKYKNCLWISLLIKMKNNPRIILSFNAENNMVSW